MRPADPFLIPSLKQHPRIRLERGAGAFCWTDDGHRLLDLTCSFGPIVLGHAHPEVTARVEERLRRGHLFSYHSEEHERLASRLLELFPGMTGCALFKTGSEAVAAAARLARAATRRSRIIRCGFHGWHDPLIHPNVDWHGFDPSVDTPTAVPGVSAGAAQDWILWRGADIAELDRLLDDRRAPVAALLVDPVQLRPPFVEAVRQLRDVTATHGALLVFDEVKTGFRVHLAGVAGRYDARPDMVVVGKALGNGFPIAGLLFNDAVRDIAPRVKLKGTFNSDLTAVVAGLATLDVLSRDHVPERLEALGEFFLDALNSSLVAAGLGDCAAGVPYRWPCMPYIRLAPEAFPDRASAGRVLADRLLDRGLLILTDHMNYLCQAHTEADLQFAVDAIRDGLRELRDDRRGDRSS